MLKPGEWHNQMNTSGSFYNLPCDKEKLIQKVRETGSALAACLYYSLFYTFCMYKNPCGITYPVLVFVTLKLVNSILGKFLKRTLSLKEHKFLSGSAVILSILTVFTDSPRLIFFNRLGIFLLIFTIALKTITDTKLWPIRKWIAESLKMLSYPVIKIYKLFADISFFISNKTFTDKKSLKIKAALAGILIAVPFTFFIVLFLSISDIIFSKIVMNLLSNFSSGFNSNFIGIFFLTAVIFVFSYGFLKAFLGNKINSDLKEIKKSDAYTAVTFTSIISIVYVMFSLVQIFGLFLRKMELPAGMTYAQYAKHGFYSLVVVCILNFLLVIFCNAKFEKNKILQGLLTLISVCTIIMVFSSIYRMALYVHHYQLTFSRAAVLLALTIIAILMGGLIYGIYNDNFNLFNFIVVTITVCYICFSAARPEYLIAKFNISQYKNGCDVDINYVCRLSSDALPAWINIDEELNLKENFEDSEEKTIFKNYFSARPGNMLSIILFNEDASHNAEYIDYNPYKMYQNEINFMDKNYHELNIRNFNFSRFYAGYLIENKDSVSY